MMLIVLNNQAKVNRLPESDQTIWMCRMSESALVMSYDSFPPTIAYWTIIHKKVFIIYIISQNT